MSATVCQPPNGSHRTAMRTRRRLAPLRGRHARRIEPARARLKPQPLPTRPDGPNGNFWYLYIEAWNSSRQPRSRRRHHSRQHRSSARTTPTWWKGEEEQYRMSSSTGKKLRAELPRRQRPHMLLHTPLASGSIDHISWDIVRQQNREVTFADQLAKATQNPRWQADIFVIVEMDYQQRP